MSDKNVLIVMTDEVRVGVTYSSGAMRNVPSVQLHGYELEDVISALLENHSYEEIAETLEKVS